MTPEMFTDNLGEIDRRQKELVAGLRSMLGLAAKVTLVAPKSIVRSEARRCASSTSARFKEGKP